MKFSLITPDEHFIETKITQLKIPAHDGLLGIWPGHSSLLCQLNPGLLYYQDALLDEYLFFVDNGFAHVCDDEIMILTRMVMTSEDILISEAEEMLLEAQILPMNTAGLVESRTTAIHRARELIKLAKMRPKQ